MKKFLDESFLLSTKTAQTLYDDYAKKQPIFDYHCHLSPKEIYEDKRYENITQVWLGGDHYKWRIMRELGIDERYITGDAEPREKFQKYAEAIAYAIGNPLYHWTHLELKRYFAIDEILTPKTAESIWNKANQRLEKLSARELIKMNNVKALFTTDDPLDDLKYHKLLAQDKSFDVIVRPAFRPDKAINIELSAFSDYIKRLGEVTGLQIDSIEKLTQALTNRIEYFNDAGCICSDHALDVVMYATATQEQADDAFKKALRGQALSSEEIARYKGFVLLHVGREYAKRHWVQQYHIGALRNVSTRYMRTLGADTGFDCIEDQSFAHNLAAILDSLDITNQLPKTILYCLNPRDNEVLAAIMNCFQAAGVEGKIQFGSAWWFNDQKDGMMRQIEALSQFGLLSKFVGMLTDSRSFLSYTRHEYFRRILCEKLGKLIENGEYPNDMEFVGSIVEDICFNNAMRYFGIE